MTTPSPVLGAPAALQAVPPAYAAVGQVAQEHPPAAAGGGTASHPVPTPTHAPTTASTTAAPDHAADHGGFFAQPEFWVAVAFLIVVGFAFKRVVGAVGTALDIRAEKIRSKLDEARRLREDAQQLLAEYQRKQRDALKEADDIIAHARAEAQRQKKEALAELEEAVRRREAQALDRIAQAEFQATAEVRNLAVDIAIGAATRLIQEQLSPQQVEVLVDRAIAELPAKLQ